MSQSRLRRSRLGYGIAVGISAFGLAACGGGDGEKTVTELEPRPELSLKEKAGDAYGKVLSSSVIYCEGKKTRAELEELTKKIGKYSSLRLDLLDEDTLNNSLDGDEEEIYSRSLDQAFPVIDTDAVLTCTMDVGSAQAEASDHLRK